MDRDKLLAMCGCRIAEHDVPGVGRVRLREMSGRDRDAYFTALLSAPKVEMSGRSIPNPAGLRGLVVSFVLVGDDDKPLFRDGEDANASLKPEAIDAIFSIASKVNALGNDEEELEGN